MNQVPGGLGELPAAIGPSDQQQQQINDRWNTYQIIENHLVTSGIYPLRAPIVGIPEITPEILRGLNDDQYMEVYNAIDAWNSYIGETVSQVQNIILQIENEMEDLAIHVEENLKLTAKMEGKKPTAEEVKHAVKAHARQRWLKLEHQKNQQTLNRLTSRQKTLARSERLLSRNIELIKSAREIGAGGGGIQRRGSAQLPPRIS